jgi:hypothetical protein
MAEQTNESVPRPLALPDNANLEWLRKQAKRQLAELRASQSDAKLADAQFSLAKSYGFSSWRALKVHVDSRTLEGQLVDATRAGDTSALIALLDAHRNAIDVRIKPYAWTLLHVAAHAGQLAAVNLLLDRGAPVDVREKGDETTPLFWAAASGHLDVVKRLIAANADVNASGDDHELGVIGWRHVGTRATTMHIARSSTSSSNTARVTTSSRQLHSHAATKCVASSTQIAQR